MRKIIELDIDDIKKLISARYGVKEEEIKWQYKKPNYDEKYPLSMENVIFSFEDSLPNYIGIIDYAPEATNCPICGGAVRKNLSKVLTTYPPKYEYVCERCGQTEYRDN